MFKTENHCKTPQVPIATDGTRHTGKRGLRTLERTQGPWTERRTLSPRILKRILLLRTLKKTLSLRNLKWALSMRTIKSTKRAMKMKWKISKHWVYHYSKIWANINYFRELKETFIYEIASRRNYFFIFPIFVNVTLIKLTIK